MERKARSFSKCTTAIIIAITIAIADVCHAWEARRVRVEQSDLYIFNDDYSHTISACQLRYYYFIEDCAYVTVLGLDIDQTIGVHFNMADRIPWLNPCDTSSCLTLDQLDIFLYDVLPPPNSQQMNVKIYEADEDGEPTGDLIANVNFEPNYTGSQRLVKCILDFTDNQSRLGIDLSGCRGNFVVLLTWKNTTNHPLLVLDNISECVDSCSTNPACCQMGTYPFIYPRSSIHTYYYGSDGGWQKLGGICDEGGCGTYGYLEAFWECHFCIFSPSTEPDTWGSLKGMYR